MKTRTQLLAVTLLTAAIAGMSGCSDEAKEKWKQTGSAATEAVKQTAHDTKEVTKKVAADVASKSKEVMEEVKEGAHKAIEKGKKVIQQAKATDPDTGEAMK